MGETLTERIYVTLDHDGEDTVAYNNVEEAIEKPGISGTTTVTTYQKVETRRLTKLEKTVVLNSLGDLVVEVVRS